MTACLLLLPQFDEARRDEHAPARHLCQHSTGSQRSLRIRIISIIDEDTFLDPFHLQAMFHIRQLIDPRLQLFHRNVQFSGQRDRRSDVEQIVIPQKTRMKRIALSFDLQHKVSAFHACFSCDDAHIGIFRETIGDDLCRCLQRIAADKRVVDIQNADALFWQPFDHRHLLLDDRLL